MARKSREEKSKTEEYFGYAALFLLFTFFLWWESRGLYDDEQRAPRKYRI